MRGLEEAFLAADVRVACIVQAQPGQLPKECKPARHITWISDPEKESYRAMGLGAMPLRRMFAARDLRRRHKLAKARGFRQSWRRTFARESGWLLLPGVALVDRRGRILWMHRGEHMGDIPPPDALLAIAQEHWDPKSSESRPSA